MVSFTALLLLPVLLLAAGLVAWVASHPIGSATAHPATGTPIARPSWEPERLFVYALALAGLTAAAYGTAGMLGTLVVSVSQPGSTIVNADVHVHTSYYLATLIVGLPIWLGLWLRTQRRLPGSAVERAAPERRLYLGLVFGGASVAALFGLHTVLRVILTVPGTAGVDRTMLVRAGIFAGARMLVWATIWLFHARLRRAEKAPGIRDGAHDLGIFTLAGFSLAFLVIGLFEAGHWALGLLANSQGEGGSAAWLRWGGIAAWILAGLPVWLAIWSHDLRRRGLHPVRILYLGLVVTVAAGATLASAEAFCYFSLHNAFRHPSPVEWSFVSDWVPPLLLGAIVWAYHWAVMRRQALFAEEAGIARTPIPWPRRPLILSLALLCLGAACVALAALSWLVVDAVMGRATGGWHDRVSVALPALVMGGGLWLVAWSTAQRAVRRDPGIEASTEERQRHLGAIVILSTLTAVGFTVALAVVLFQALLGTGLSVESVSRCLKDVATVALALAVAGYHGSILLRERPLRSRRRTLRLLALVAPEAQETLAELDGLRNRRVELVGYLTTSGGDATMSVAELDPYLEGLESRTRVAGALLYVYVDGITVVPFHKGAVPESLPQANATRKPLAAGE